MTSMTLPSVKTIVRKKLGVGINEAITKEVFGKHEKLLDSTNFIDPIVQVCFLEGIPVKFHLEYDKNEDSRKHVTIKGHIVQLRIWAQECGRVSYSATLSTGGSLFSVHSDFILMACNADGNDGEFLHDEYFGKLNLAGVLEKL